MIKDMPNKFSEVTPEIKELAKKCEHKIDEELFAKYNVNSHIKRPYLRPFPIKALFTWENRC